MAYLNDIIIFSPTLEDHKKHINKKFDHLRQHDLKLILQNVNSCKMKHSI